MTGEDAAMKIWNASGEGWNKLSEIKDRAGLTQDELTAGIMFWAEADDVQIEPEAFGHRLLADRDYAAAGVTLGGETRHLIKFGE